MKDRLVVYFSGSPSGGFTSYPIKYKSKAATTDSNAFGKGAVLSTINIDNNTTTLKYIVYGIGSALSDKRSGRNFGIWIEIDGLMPPLEDLPSIHNFFEQLFTKGIVTNEDVDILKQDRGQVVYTINSFSENSEVFNKLINLTKKIFIEDFASTLIQIPDKYKLPITSLVKRNDENSSTRNLDQLSTKTKSQFETSNADNYNSILVSLNALKVDLKERKARDKRTHRFIYIALSINLIIAVIALSISMINSSNSSETGTLSEIKNIHTTPSAEYSADDFTPKAIVYRNDSVRAYINADLFLDHLKVEPIVVENVDQFLELMAKYLINNSKELNKNYQDNPQALVMKLKEFNPTDLGRLENLIKDLNTNGMLDSKDLANNIEEQSILKNFLVHKKR